MHMGWLLFFSVKPKPLEVACLFEVMLRRMRAKIKWNERVLDPSATTVALGWPDKRIIIPAFFDENHRQSQAKTVAYNDSETGKAGSGFKMAQ